MQKAASELPGALEKAANDLPKGLQKAAEDLPKGVNVFVQESYVEPIQEDLDTLRDDQLNIADADAVGGIVFAALTVGRSKNAEDLWDGLANVNNRRPQSPDIDINKIGTGQIGNFQDVKDVNDLISRIPADAKQIPWREVPRGAKDGVKFRWVDESGKTWDVRAHSEDPTAPPGSNAANGWIYRVEVKQVNPKWKWTMDSNGNFHKENVLREKSPYYDESIANDTHIPFKP
ncbi:polymorphic toxin type 30 domain-containing protein [Brevibacillus sp. 179-C9.3 HS]